MEARTLPSTRSVKSCCQCLERAKNDSHRCLCLTFLLLFTSSASPGRSTGMNSGCVWSDLESIFGNGDCVIELHGAPSMASAPVHMPTHARTHTRTHAHTCTRTHTHPTLLQGHPPHTALSSASPDSLLVSSELAENLASSLPELAKLSLHQKYSCK